MYSRVVLCVRDSGLAVVTDVLRYERFDFPPTQKTNPFNIKFVVL